ncbi:MAG: DUF4902 domain-containing protein [Pseudomonadota bacterium]
MIYHTNADAYSCTQVPMITLSEDGYIRLTLETLLATPFVHFLSGLDDEKTISPQEGACYTHISGYTEWLSTTPPTLTLGWDWGLDVSQGQPLYVRLGAPRSNIMLVDTMQHDLGPTKTSVLLETAIDALAWQEEVHHHLVTRYV